MKLKTQTISFNSQKIFWNQLRLSLFVTIVGLGTVSCARGTTEENSSQLKNDSPPPGQYNPNPDVKCLAKIQPLSSERKQDGTPGLVRVYRTDFSITDLDGMRLIGVFRVPPYMTLPDSTQNMDCKALPDFIDFPERGTAAQVNCNAGATDAWEHCKLKPGTQPERLAVNQGGGQAPTSPGGTQPPLGQDPFQNGQDPEDAPHLNGEGAGSSQPGPR
jgi:hypothetical protein